jgi:hypothetical protein
MTDLEKAARQALDALENEWFLPTPRFAIDAIDALRAALEQAEPVDLDQQVRDIAAGVGLPPADSSTVPDPILDCDCGRRWCWTDGAGWGAKQTEQRVVTGVDPISGLPFKDTLKFTLDQQQAEPMTSTTVIQAAWKMGFDAAKAEQAEPMVVTVRESQQRKRLNFRLAGRKKGPSVDAEFGVPHLAEDTDEAEPVVERAMRKCSLCGFEREDACEILNCGLRDWGKK